jgi:phosphatidate cytidylyltransferase
MNELVQRSIFGGLYVTLVVVVLRVFPQFTSYLFVLFSALCYREALLLAGISGRKAPPMLIILWFALWIAVFLPEYNTFVLPVTSIALIWSATRSRQSRQALLRGVYVLQPFIISILAIKYQLINAEFLLFVFAVIWLNDTGAYLSGKKFGNHLLAPLISPKKTWEGFAGGIITAVAAQWVLFPFFFEDHIAWKASLVAVLISCAATMGDLIQSRMKRIAGVKDSGNILPGHGGAFDRLDSFIFALPVALFFYLIIPGTY